jgi:acetylglutamate kinase
MRVIKVGGRAQADPRLAHALASLWRSAPSELVIVHGGGDEVSALQRAVGVEPRFVNGRRVTAPEDIDRLRMALSGLANKRLVAALVAAGADALGLSGEDAALLSAVVAEDGALGAVGTVRAVRVTVLRHLLAAGYLPVISPLSSGLNINGDDAAAAIAVALGADELLFVSDVPAVLPGGVTGGMHAKMAAATGAAEGGVGRVRIGDLSMLANEDAGTTVVPGVLA